MNEILIVEDDQNINNLLSESLQKEGYSYVQAFSGTEAKMLLEKGDYALILLDLMLPGISGEILLQEIREKSGIPVIVLTAKDEVDQKVDLLKRGADDYVTKPFEIKEVIARIEVQLRNKRNGTSGQILAYKGMKIDKNMYQITMEGELLSNITKQEFSILELFLEHPKQVFSKEDIFEYAWNDYFMGETKTLDVHISNIRKKIRKITPVEYIETVWGIGYRLKG